MRLLNAGTFELEYFVADVPPYTILSHTWGKDEVTFQDITTDLATSTAKEGFTKIRYCAAQTLSDGLTHCWVDTCCIDKTSSAELSEAINSMFRWYREAQCCYIYLSDVHAEPADEFGESLRHSRWFTRGWTLQELIASLNRFFFDAEWNLIGRVTPEVDSLDEESPTSPVRFQSRLMEIEDLESFPLSIALDTKIPLDLLSHRTTLEDYCIAEKMRWAADRQTSRVEDIAYCLLGLFDVNMPLLYGEGHKAFIRLQEEIIKISHDHSILLWRSNDDGQLSGSYYRGLFARHPKEFDSSWSFVEETVPGQNFQFPYAMTNRGLEMRLPVLPTGVLPGEFIAALGCAAKKGTDNKETDKPHYLILAQLGAHHQFARVDLHGFNLDTDIYTMKDFEAPESVKQVYVNHKIAIAPDYNTSRLENFVVTPPSRSLQLALRGASPKEGWDAQSRTLTLRKTLYEPLMQGVRTGKIVFDSLAGFVYIIRIQVGFAIDGGSQCKLAKVAAEKYNPDSGDDDLEWADSVEFTTFAVRRGATFPLLGSLSPDDDGGHAPEERCTELRLELKSRLIEDKLHRLIKLVAVPAKGQKRDLIMELPSPRPSLIGRRTF